MYFTVHTDDDDTDSLIEEGKVDGNRVTAARVGCFVFYIDIDVLFYT
jgi:hypothetical protein